MKAPLSIPQTITLLRNKYPEALICCQCARLLASRGYNDTADYICAECRSTKVQTTLSFERLKGRTKPPTEAQLAQADAFCATCRRWFYSGCQGGMVCGACQSPPQALISWDNPAPSKQARLTVRGLWGYPDKEGALEPVVSTHKQGGSELEKAGHGGRRKRAGRKALPTAERKARAVARKRRNRAQKEAA